MEKRSPTLLVPGVGRRYKSTIIAELRNNPELSTDRLRRVRGAGTSSEIDNDSTQADNSDSVGLFDDCAFYEIYLRQNSTNAQERKERIC